MNLVYERIVDSFIENYYSLKACLKLHHILTFKDDKQNKELIKYFIDKNPSEEMVKSFVDLYMSANYNGAIKNINTLLINDKIVTNMKDEVAYIRETNSFYFGDVSNYEFYLYNSLFKGHSIDLDRKLIEKESSIYEDDFINHHIDEIVDFFIENNLSIYNLFKGLCNNYKSIYKSAIKRLYSSLDPNHKRIYRPLLPIDFVDIKTLDDIKNNLKVITNFDKYIDVIINDLRNEQFDNRIKDLEFLFSVPNFEISPYNLTRITSLFQQKKLIEDYYKNRNNYSYGYYKKLDINNIDYSRGDYSILEGYFNIKYELESYTGYDSNGRIYYYPNIRFILKDLYNNDVIVLQKEDEDIKTLVDKLDYNNSVKYARYLYIAIMNNEKFNTDLNNLLTSIDKENEDLIISRVLDKFKDIEDKTLSEEVSKYSVKAHLEYNFTNDNGMYLLDLKVSNNKRNYIISNVQQFTKYFVNNESHRYGKDLILNHDVNNFVEEDRKFLELIIHSHFDYNGKYIYMSPFLFKNVFESLDQHYITIDDNLYYLDNEEMPLEFYLDKDYHLKISDKYKDLNILHVDNVIYLLNKNEHRINKLKKDNIDLYNFVNEYGRISLHKVKDQFKNRIYPIYKDYIVLDESIKDEFDMSKLTIDSYIDLEDDFIVLKYKLLKGQVEINKLDNVIDSSLFERYRIILSKIGFNDEFKIIDQDAILNFFKLDLSSLKKFGNIFLSEALNNKKILTFTPPVIKMQYDSNTMKVFIRDSEYSNEELEKVLNAIKHNKKYVLLKDNTILKLDEKSNKFLDLIEDLSLDKKDLSKEVHIPLYKTLGIDYNENSVESDDYLNKMVSDIKNFKTSDIKLPVINASLRDYQRYGYNWLKILSSYNLGGILGDDMGLGKTLMSITTIVSDESKEPSLIVSPKSLVFNWMNEFNKFSPDSDVRFIYGSQLERRNMIESIDKNKKVIYLTSYDSLRNDIEFYKNKFNFVFLDEAQYIKNVNALKTINVKKLKASHRFCLTGTPIENDIFDLWSIFDFLMPSYLPSLNKFKKYGNDVNFIESIKRKIAPFILRRTKSEVLDDLPPKTEKIISCELSAEQRKLYDATCLKAKTLLNSGSKAFDVLPLLMRLRQICVDPHTFVDDYNGESSKMNLLYETIDKYIKEGRRMLVFSQFVSALDIIEEHLRSKNIKYFVITGKTDSKKRIEYVNEFNSNDEYKVFLVSLKAGGNGLNLTGADTVIHLDPWWNVAVENQATDRAHRIGQTHSVEVLKLIVEDSVEQRVIELQNKKQELIDALISDDTSLIEKMSIDDLKFILK